MYYYCLEITFNSFNYKACTKKDWDHSENVFLALMFGADYL